MTTVYTIGHSTHSQEEFQRMLTAHGVRCLVDIRRYPGSRRYPQFSKDSLSQCLPVAGIEYVHELALGGRRKPVEDSPNIYWRNAQFRAYADYMATAEFQEALQGVLERAARKPTAIMCAEAVPWRCHRNLVADALTFTGHPVLHIMSPTKADVHTLNAAAHASADGTLIYRGSEAEQKNLF